MQRGLPPSIPKGFSPRFAEDLTKECLRIAKSVQWVLVVPSMKQIMTRTKLTAAIQEHYCSLLFIIAQVKDVGGYD